MPQKSRVGSRRGTRSVSPQGSLPSRQPAKTQHTTEWRHTTSATQSEARLIQLFAQAFLLQASCELCKAKALQRHSEERILKKTHSPLRAAVTIASTLAASDGKSSFLIFAATACSKCALARHRKPCAGKRKRKTHRQQRVRASREERFCGSCCQEAGGLLALLKAPLTALAQLEKQSNTAHTKPQATPRP